MLSEEHASRRRNEGERDEDSLMQHIYPCLLFWFRCQPFVSRTRRRTSPILRFSFSRLGRMKASSSLLRPLRAIRKLLIPSKI